jgi:hypothetical protein
MMTNERFVEVMTSPHFTKGEKFICQAEYRNDTLSTFEQALWRILCAADEKNLSKLCRAFPQEANAFKRWRYGGLRQMFEQPEAIPSPKEM